MTQKYYLVCSTWKSGFVEKAVLTDLYLKIHLKACASVTSIIKSEVTELEESDYYKLGFDGLNNKSKSSKTGSTSASERTSKSSKKTKSKEVAKVAKPAEKSKLPQLSSLEDFFKVPNVPKVPKVPKVPPSNVPKPKRTRKKQ
jgi:hypothetical protein